MENVVRSRRSDLYHGKQDGLFLQAYSTAYFPLEWQHATQQCESVGIRALVCWMVYMVCHTRSACINVDDFCWADQRNHVGFHEMVGVGCNLFDMGDFDTLDTIGRARHER